jgi:hypothetical protein
MFKELPNRSRVGGVFVSRFNTDDGGDYNLTYGIDGQWGVGQSLLFEGYAAQTQTPGRTGADYAYNLSANYKDRDWELGLAYRAVQEDFNPEVGFVSYGNTQFLSYTALRHLRTPNVSWFREFRPHVTVRQYMDFDGFITNRLIHVDNHFQFANGAFFQLPALNFTRDGLRDPFEIRPGIIVPVGTYDNFFFGFSYNTNLSAPLSVSGRIELGGFYTGKKQSNQVTVVGRFGNFLGELKSTFDHVTLPEGNFDASLASVKLAYSFTPHIYVQSQVQYNNETENVSANVRFGWLNAAGTGLFLVYNGLERTGLEPGPVDRAFTIKFTRLFGL